MNFLDIILFIIIFVILIVIVYNFFAYGSDLSIYPKSSVKRVSDEEYYPGSPLYDEYTDDDYSDDSSDDGYYDTDMDNKGLPKRRYPTHAKHQKHAKHQTHQKHPKNHINTKRVADYVAGHINN